MSILDEMKEVASWFNEYLFSTLDGEPKELYDASYHLMKSGGKRMRPFMVLKSYELFNNEVERALPAAAALEFLHTFTLAHDDIMDNDSFRHGVPTIHVKYNTSTAILAGDVLFAAAFQSVSKRFRELKFDSERAIRIVELLVDASIKICEGQAQDLIMAATNEFHESLKYFQMIEKKTAALFEASCRIGSIAGGGSKKDEDSLGEFGNNFGVAFQMIDDVLGAVGDRNITGKPVGNDILQGKKTYVIALAVEEAEKIGNQDILNAFGNRDSSKEDVWKAVQNIASSGVADKVRSKSRSYSEKALSYLSSYPNCPAKNSLVELTEFMVTRNL